MAENTKVNVTKQVAEGVDRKSKKVFGSVASLGGPAALYYDLGTPIVADVDRIVVSVNMKIGKYTIAAQPDVPRIITCTRTVVGNADTPGTITITGTNADDEPITEVLTPGAHGVLVSGTLAFKTVKSVVGAGWAIDAVGGSEDTITVGVGAAIGLPIAISRAAQVINGVLGTAFAAPSVSADSLKVLEKSLITLTWDGTKRAGVFITN